MQTDNLKKIFYIGFDEGIMILTCFMYKIFKKQKKRRHSCAEPGGGWEMEAETRPAPMQLLEVFVIFLWRDTVPYK